MIKILTLILFLASSSSLIANDVFNFVNHEPIKTIEYKTCNYDNQKIKIPIINGIAPEVTIKNRNNYKETTYDYTNKTKFDSNKNYVTEEKQNEINKEKEINKKIQSMEEKIQSMEDKVQLLLTTMSNLYLQLEEQKVISNKQEAKQLDLKNDIFKKINDIADDVKNMGEMEKTMDIIEKMKNDDIKEKITNKLQKTPVPNIIQKNEEKTPKMKKPSEVIK
jgi:TolA-binding protein